MKLKAFLYIILTTILIALAQVFFKFGMDSFSFSDIITNYFLFLGMIFYGLGSISLILSFKEEKISSVYPLIGMVYIWVSFASYYFFNEIITYSKVLGISSIIIGVIFITK